MNTQPNVKAPGADWSRKAAVGVAKAKPTERKTCDQQRLLVPPHQAPAPTTPASMQRIPWHQAVATRSWIPVHKAVQVPDITSSTDENDVVVLDITPSMPVIPLLTRPGDVSSTGNPLEEWMQINSHLDFQPEFNTFGEVYKQGAEGVIECQEKMNHLGVVIEN